MNKLLHFAISLALLCAFFNSNAQSWQWAVGATGGGEGVMVAADAAGNSFITGYNINSSLTFGPVTLTGLGGMALYSTVVAKYDPHGNFLWLHDLTGSSGGSVYPVSMSTDDEGNLYLLGFYGGTALNASGTVVANPSRGSEMYLVKYAPSGSLIFAKNVANVNFGSAPIPSSGVKFKGQHVYIAGTFLSAVLNVSPFTLTNSGSGGTTDGFVCKLDTLGNVEWAKSFGGASSEQMVGMDVSNREDIYLAGSFQSSPMTFGTLSVPNPGLQSMFIARYDSSGTPIWAEAAGGMEESLSGLATDTAGNTYITGSYNAPLTFGSIALTTPPAGIHFYYQFLAKYDATGSVVWAKDIVESANDNFSGTVITTPCGNLWVSGGMSIGGSATTDGHTLSAPAGSTDPLFIAEYTPAGVYLNGLTLPGGGEDMSGMAVDGYGNLFFGADYDGHAFTMGSLTLSDPATGPEDIFMVKYGAATIDTTYAHTDTCVAGSAVLNAPAGYANYKWYDGGTAATHSVSAAGAYWVLAGSGCGSSSVFIDTFNISEGAGDTIYKHSDTSLCPSASLMLTGPVGYASHLWDNGSISPSITVTGAGTHWVVSPGGCTLPTAIDTFHISVNTTTLAFSLGDDTTVCAPVMLTVPLSGVSYLWQDGSHNSSFLATSSGTYKATVSENGCSYSDSVKVTIQNLTQNLHDTTVCRDQGISLQLIANVPAGATVRWSTGSTQPSITATDTGSYWVYVYTKNCEQTDTMLLHSQLCYCNASLPDAFTPNNDGKNDFYGPIVDPACNIDNYSFMIFNRWGQQVFYSTDPTKKWDGKLDGTPAQMGTYMYYMKYTAGPLKTNHVLKGDLALIR